MTNWIEVSDRPLHGVPPKLVHEDDVDDCVGFRSVYSYPEETAKWISKNWSDKHQVFGSVNGLVASGMDVGSDRIYMDIDDDPESAAKWLKCLKDWNISHSVWDSGNRSVHIHIVTPYKCDRRIPHSQRVFLEQWGASIGATTDTSIYHAAGLYRLPGTIHAKTGRAKTFVSQHVGTALDYPIADIRKSVKPEDEGEVLSVLWRLLLTPMQAGGRRFHLWKMCSQADKLGWDVDKILEHMLEWNKWNEEKWQLSEQEIEQKVMSSL